MDLQEEAITLLAEVWKAHGYAIGRVRDWLVVEPSRQPPFLSAGVLLHPGAEESRVILQLDIRVAFGSTNAETIIESFAGVGTDVQDALRNAFANFINNSLHVFLAAFWDPQDEHVTTEYWDIGGRHWRAVIGNCGFRTEDGGGTVPLPETVYSDLAALVHARVPTQPGGIHWFRFYYSNFGGEPYYEVLFNNEVWPEAQDAIARLSWDTSRSYSARCFTLLRAGHFSNTS